MTRRDSKKLLLYDLKNNKPERFWMHMPVSSQNWLLAFEVGKLDRQQIYKRYEPMYMKSYGNGPKYYLGWLHGQGTP